MSVCRTCLSTEDLGPIFTEENLNVRSEQLLLVTGVKIEPNDSLSQQICLPCTTLVNEALKLREQSRKTELVLKDQQLNYDIDIRSEIANDNDYIFIINKKKVKRKTTKNVMKKGKTKFKFIKQEKVEGETNKNKTDFDRIFSKNEDMAEQSIDSGIDVKKVERSEPVKRRQRLSKEQLQKYMSLAVEPCNKKGPVQCRVCYKELRAVRYFINHAKTHFEAQYTCETCGKKFVNGNSLRYHQQRLHGAMRRHACTRCQYRAVDPLQLQNHERAAHTGERPYMCDVCGDTFRLRAGVAQHMRTHFASKTVQCERCPAMFRSRSELAIHRNKVHLMSYTYFCYLCSGKYKAVSTVKNHLVRTHGVPRDQHLPIKCIKKKKESNEE